MKNNSLPIQKKIQIEDLDFFLNGKQGEEIVILVASRPSATRYSPVIQLFTVLLLFPVI